MIRRLAAAGAAIAGIAVAAATAREPVPEGPRIVEINADGSCRKKLFKGTATRLYYGPLWRPGSGREAGRIIC